MHSNSNMYIYSLSLSTAISQSPDNCIETIDTNINNILYLVPSGTLCVDCVIDDVRVTDFEFSINNRELMPPNEIVVNDTLIVLDTSIVFSDVLTPVRCSNNIDVTRQIFVTLQGEALSYLLPLSSGLISFLSVPNTTICIFDSL